MTPLVEVDLGPKSNKRVFAKLENENPTGSLKDRMVDHTLDLLIQNQNITTETIIVEASSGNTGIALASACAKRNLKAIICVAQHISADKKQNIIELGAELREFDTSSDTEAEIKAASELGKEDGFHFFNQFENPHHVDAYKETLGNEIIDQLNLKQIQIDYLIAGVGSGASLRAVGELLREKHNSELKIIAVSPDKHPTKIEGLHPGHIRGDFKIWKNRPKRFEDDRLFLSDKDAIRGAIELKNKFNLEVGPCSGGLYHVVLNVLDTRGNYLLLFSDSGDRYKKYF